MDKKIHFHFSTKGRFATSSKRQNLRRLFVGFIWFAYVWYGLVWYGKVRY